jgi:hypothetical protein
MYQLLFLIVLFAVFLPVTNAYWVMCHPGAYCGPQQNLVPQAGAFATPEDCGAQCLTLGATYKYSSYVPGTQQCLCSTTCDPTIPNPDVNSYCLNIDYWECWPGNYCNDTSLVVQVGTYGTPQLCADQCWVTNSKNVFFNLQTISQQCMCLTRCSQLVPAQNISAFSLNGAECIVGGTKNLRTHLRI